MLIVLRSSPNKNDRPAGVRPSLIVVHGTAGSSDAGDVSWCCTSQAQLDQQHGKGKYSAVSYHYIIGRDGKIYQLVPDDKRAWHAGVSSYNGRKGCNDFSIGIGISNNGEEDYTAKQYTACKELVEMLRTKHDIPLVRVVGHCHVSPGRKTDPWLHFEWMRIA